MADAKLTALTELSVPALEDLLYAVDDPSGTPASVKSSGKRHLAIGAHVVEGRLTLTSGTPVTTADVTGATSVFFTPFNGNRVRVYDGTRWQLYTFSELTLALGTLVAFQGYDVFLYDNAGTLTLESNEWSNATATMTIASPCVVTWTSHGLVTGNSVTFTTSGALPTGISANTQYWVHKIDANTFHLSTSVANLSIASWINTSGSQSGTHTAHAPHARQTALATQDGVLVKSGATTRLYLGAFMTTSTTTTESSAGGVTTQVGGRQFLSNYYNEVHRNLSVFDSTNSWSYSTATFRTMNGNGGNKVEFFVGYAGQLAEAQASGFVTGGTGADYGTNIAFDEPSTMVGYGGATYQTTQSMHTIALVNPGIGYHHFSPIEKGATSAVFIGDDGTTGEQTGLKATVFG